MSAIDISYWQHSPNFAQVRNAGVSLVIMKCGGGEGGRLYTDSVYVGNRAAARAVGLAVGSYFFNGPVDATAAADYQFSIIDWHTGDVVAIDVENNGSQPHWTPGQVLAWCTRMIAHGVPASRILVYMSSSVLTAGWNAVVALGVGLWVAQYGPNDGSPHSLPSAAPWPAWSLWQYSSVGSVPGIAGSIDMNQISPSFASGGETPLTPSTTSGDDTMRVIRSTSGTIATITDSAGAKVWSLPQITRAAAEAKVFNPTGTYIDVSDAELTVLIEEANLRKTVATVTGASVDLTPVLDAIKAIPVGTPATVNLTPVLDAIKAIPASPRTFIAQ